jgi:hypothetical protein
MLLEDRKKAFVLLGKKIASLEDSQMDFIWQKTRNNNSWFSENSIKKTIWGILRYLDPEKIDQWLEKYPTIYQNNITPRSVGVVMAGNIPAVGFHDFMSVLMAGHSIQAKLSSDDNILIPAFAGLLTEIEPRFKEKIDFVEMIKNADAYIATGSDSSAKYFEAYFSKKPNLIRRNRVSVAVLNGTETQEDFNGLGEDIFSYFGLGCRNVAKIYVPKNYDFAKFYEGIEHCQPVINHHKYANNYDYNKAIYLIKPVKFLDNGFLLIAENQEITSPPSVLYYEFYENGDDLAAKLHFHKSKIQCIVSKNAWYLDSFTFGEAQKPQLWDYADGIDTMKFLINI